MSGNLWIKVFLPFAAGYYLSYLLRTVNAVIAPELARELALGAAELGLLTSAYLLTFAAFQIPLGLLLDRYGPRRVEGGLLLVAAAGTLLFAFGNSATELAVARGLIGLGVSSCLMAAFKGFAQNFPAERQASLTGAIMASGGLGAVTASLPLELALPPEEVYRSQVEIVLPKWQGWAKEAKRKLDEAKAKDAATTGKELGKAA